MLSRLSSVFIHNRRKRLRRRQQNRFARFERLEDRRLLTAYDGSGGVIADNSTTNFTNDVPDSVSIGDVNVTLDVSHKRDQDLDVYLVAPDGTRVELFSDVGSNGDHFSGTTLDDEASGSVIDGSAPFSGTYRPEGSLSSFDGKDSAGVWTLEVTDDKKREAGTLNSWSLDITPQVPPTISYPDFSDTTGLSLVGEATITAENVLRLTPQITTKSGGAWYSTPQVATVGFETTFQFQVTSLGSDGFAFVLQDGGDTVLSGGGGSMGYDKLPNSLAIEFDTFSNFENPDPNNNHVSIHTNGTGPNGPSESFSLGVVTPTFDINDGSPHTAKVRYDGVGTLSLYLEDMGTPALEVSVDLSQLLDWDFGRAYVGFTAASGGSAQSQDILSWDYRVLADTTTTIAVGNAEVLEGDAGTTNLEFTVARQGDTSGVATVDWATSDGTATTDDNDYLAASGQVSFADGVTQQTVSITVNGDAVEEAHETLKVTLSNPSVGTIVDANGAGTILNDEASISIDDVSATEGDESIRFIDAFVTAGSGGLDNPGDLVLGPDGNLYVGSKLGDSILRYDAATGELLGTFVATGSGGLDGPQGLLLGPDGNLYVTSRLTDEVLRFNGTTGAFIDEFVTAGSDGLDDPVELALGADGNLYVSSRYTDEILRYDGTTGTALGAFTTAGSGGLNSPHDLVFGPDDNLYVASQATLSVLRYSGITGAFIDEFVTSGSGGLTDPVHMVFGPDGDLYVGSALNDSVLRYNGSTGAFIEDYVSAGSGGLDRPIGLLFDADGNLYVSSRDTDEVLRYGAASQAVFTVSLSAPSALPVTVDYNMADGTATVIDGDYNAFNGTITFAPGETTKTIVVSTIDDAVEEPDESFFVNLSAATGAVIQDAQGEATITDDDAVNNPNALYVYDIRFESKRHGKDWRAVFEIRNDSNADGLAGSDDSVRAGVTVTVNFAGQTFTGTTDANGIFRTSWLRNLGSGNHYANAVDLVLAGYFWAPLDLDDEDDSDGDGRPDDLLVL